MDRVPTGIQTTAMTPCARIDYFKQYVGLDITLLHGSAGQSVLGWVA